MWPKETHKEWVAWNLDSSGGASPRYKPNGNIILIRLRSQSKGKGYPCLTKGS